MEMVKNGIAWVEIPVAEFARAKKFYSAIFAFDMPEMEMGPVRMGILLHDQAGGGVGGAICAGPDYVPSQQGSLVYLDCGTDVSPVLARVAAAGGTVIGEKTEIPGMGFYALILDTEGNKVGLYSRV